MALIELSGIRKSFKVGPGEIPVLHGIDLTVHPGEMVSMMGQSGSGKSTLMNIIGMLDQPSAGSYRFEGVDVLSARNDEQSALRNRKIGFVFQTYYLLARLTALDNVLLPLLYRGESRRRSEPRARARSNKRAAPRRGWRGAAAYCSSGLRLAPRRFTFGSTRTAPPPRAGRPGRIWRGACRGRRLLAAKHRACRWLRSS